MFNVHYMVLLDTLGLHNTIYIVDNNNEIYIHIFCINIMLLFQLIQRIVLSICYCVVFYLSIHSGKLNYI